MTSSLGSKRSISMGSNQVLKLCGWTSDRIVGRQSYHTSAGVSGKGVYLSDRGESGDLHQIEDKRCIDNLLSCLEEPCEAGDPKACTFTEKGSDGDRFYRSQAGEPWAIGGKFRTEGHVFKRQVK